MGNLEKLRERHLNAARRAVNGEPAPRLEGDPAFEELVTTLKAEAGQGVEVGEPCDRRAAAAKGGEDIG